MELCPDKGQISRQSTNFCLSLNSHHKIPAHLAHGAVVTPNNIEKKYQVQMVKQSVSTKKFVLYKKINNLSNKNAREETIRNL